MQHTKKPYSRQQLIWIYKQYLLEESKVVHRIFDRVIYTIMKNVSVTIISGNYNTNEIIYTGYAYDSNKKVCVKTTQDDFHPIYIRYINEDDKTYEAYINMRRVVGMSPEKLEYDKIVVHINVPRIKSMNGYDLKKIARRVPSILAHEFTHAKDMWTSDYINVIDNLVNTGYSVATKDFLKKQGIINISSNDIDTINGMLYFMSPAETDATYEAFDKYLNFLSENDIITIVENDLDQDERQIAAKIFSAIKVVARVNNRFAEVRLETFTQQNNYNVPVLLTAYMVYLGYIPDTSGYFKDFSIAKEVIDGNMFPDKNMTEMMVSAFLELEIKYGEYVADMEDLIIEHLEKIDFFKNHLSDVSEKLYVPSVYVNEKLAMYGNLSELESPFQPYMYNLTCFDVPALHYILESENRNREVTMYDILGHY